MKTLLYGGTFDPPHNGHMNNLRAALALVQPDRALVMPAGTPPHKHASATPAELRLQMCACFTALSPAVQVSDWEIRQGGRSYTVHTLEWLGGQDPDGALYLCVGSDMLLTFQEWYRWQDMLKMAALVVESRTGTDEAALHAAAQLLAEGKPLLVYEEVAGIGGLGSLLQQVAAGQESRTPVHSLALPDRWIYHGKRRELLRRMELDAAGLRKTVRELLGR